MSDRDLEDRRHYKDDSWHLNKAFAYSLILLMITNLGATTWWASGINKDVESFSSVPAEVVRLREDFIRLETRITLQEGVYGELKTVITDLKDLTLTIYKEQATRTSTIRRSDEHIDNTSIHVHRK